MSGLVTKDRTLTASAPSAGDIALCAIEIARCAVQDSLEGEPSISLREALLRMQTMRNQICIPKLSLSPNRSNSTPQTFEELSFAGISLAQAVVTNKEQKQQETLDQLELLTQRLLGVTSPNENQDVHVGIFTQITALLKTQTQPVELHLLYQQFNVTASSDQKKICEMLEGKRGVTIRENLVGTAMVMSEAKKREEALKVSNVPPKIVKNFPTIDWLYYHIPPAWKFGSYTCDLAKQVNSSMIHLKIPLYELESRGFICKEVDGLGARWNRTSNTATRYDLDDIVNINLNEPLHVRIPNALFPCEELILGAVREIIGEHQKELSSFAIERKIPKKMLDQLSMSGVFQKVWDDITKLLRKDGNRFFIETKTLTLLSKLD